MIEVPALVMLGLWFVVQAVFGAVGLTDPTGGGGGVAYFAHVGGFLFGLAGDPSRWRPGASRCPRPLAAYR